MQKTAEPLSCNTAVEIDLTDLDNLLEKEWLLSNQRGSYSSGTVIGCNTRRYHGLLVASLRPPVERVMTLSNLLETVTIGEQSYELANFEFSDRLHPQGYRYLERFYRDDGVHFRFKLGQVTLEKSIYLDYEEDILIVRYEFSGGGSDQVFADAAFGAAGFSWFAVIIEQSERRSGGRGGDRPSA